MEEQPYKRPSWDEYFMELANSVSKRATCDRGRSGCVIVKDKQILVTGYVGSPAGLPHCDEVGHLFHKMIHENGEITTHCVRTMLADGNEIPCGEIFAAAKRKQISQRTVNEAKKNIDGIETRKVGAKWMWSIPNEDCNIAEVSYEKE